MPVGSGISMDETYNSIKCSGMVWASSITDPRSLVSLRMRELFAVQRPEIRKLQLEVEK